ncbi:RNA polymerase sigma factor RpoH [Thauera aminoaromatica]|jgi:RNA polymerase sigma-32 factor|uniref:RNA polymerase sigma factor RpoH n=1 Tax=Thauera aminoaromatica TaxID=164330 RepID=C4ZJ91_THASP|nr:RNA polymerase sigma factor RpoH [Thauera aminoaromatica]MDA0236681.1 RNA polymerase sigma factor RpoH [Pseudomonadota bacterium]ACK53824.1 RNA polymerase, sigma 32 subunit, RpoH [Thauera aminoaromatica]MCK6398566.1 RNA polymerase sigma factor RpoH [Thauera aminoaromatica]TXH92442.1 MAG: RNA polymerase sigma factor RpoH [Thauera aminoaromatica]HPV61276.1 RNA polymerase sigma factor RpoH [Thauera aminoaromatica]
MSQALTFPVPAAGSLDQYIQSVNRMPMLSEQQEVELATRLRDEGDVDAARQLVMSHLRVVVAIARGYLGYGLPHADLIQEGNIGLMKAVKRFDPTRGVRLVSFAIHWIKAEIHEYILKNWRLVKIATTKAQRKLFFNLRGMKQDSSTLQPAEVRSIAAQLGVKPEEVVEMETRLSGRDIPLDAGSDDEDERFAPIAYLPDPHAEPSEQVEQAQLARLQDSGLRDALASLDERSRAIVQRRWLAEGDSATLHELAAEYGVSAERIRQIEAKAMQKMRGMLAAVA